MRPKSQIRGSPLLLLLLPSIAAALAVDTSGKPGSVQHLRAAQLGKDASQSGLGVSGPTAKVGTKDAPVDGLDGKPHAGPFVESTKKKNAQLVEDLPSSRSASSAQAKEKVLKESFQLPEDDGVMSDLRDRKEVTGPTGTEGGVSQKDKERKGKGEVEKTPEQPKEAKSPNKSKDGDGDSSTKQKGAAGLQVCIIILPAASSQIIIMANDSVL
jgi:hypothetical protein